MRADMKKVIVNTGRVGFWLQDAKHRLPRDIEDWPTKEGMRRPYKERKSLGDRTRPLYRFIASRVGHPWSEVWSEICEHADARGVLGFHLRTHAKQYVRVRPDGLDFTYGIVHQDGTPASASWRRKNFWVDEKGVLRA